MQPAIMDLFSSMSGFFVGQRHQLEQSLPFSPPSATALKDSSMLSVGAAVQSAMGDTVTGTFLSTFSVVSKPGSAASATKHDETSMKSPAPRTLNLP